ncbi:MAG: class I SAM-dependent methyltransferase [Acidobacteria bacterium]|nr:class I SAM-dependent methyltransferase [Acidobacteriota bacterium]
MPDHDVCERMREDWNRRALEDASYYVAFGRREQSEEEFFATGVELAEGLARELKRLGPLPHGRGSDTALTEPRASASGLRALEIGCGLGRLMRPLAPRFTELHGVDVSDEMLRRATGNLRGVPNAHVHLTSGADLAMFSDGFFDLVYSYAVFQHIPSREVVFQYLREARRVMREGAILRFQVNGLPETVGRYDTWSGVRIPADDIAAFARDHDFQLLALEGALTQYMWITFRKQPQGWRQRLIERRPETRARIRRITNAHSSEPVAPSRGRFASVSLWLEGLSPDCDLNHLEVRVGGVPGALQHLGPPEPDGLQQLNTGLPDGLYSGLQAVEVFWLGRPLAPPATLRVIPPGPLVPRIVSVTDGIDLLSGTRITSRSVKVGVEEMATPSQLRAFIDGIRIPDADFFCVDPVPPRFEVNLRLPEAVGPGSHQLELSVGTRCFAPITVEVA